MTSNKMTVNIDGLGPVDITHHEIKDNWDEIPIELTEDNIKHLEEVEPILKENGLTINDLLASLFEYIINNEEKIKTFCNERRETKE